MAVAFTTFCIFVPLNLLRVNIFLNSLMDRPDWQHMVMRFRASDAESLRMFVTVDYLAGAPLKIVVATAIGAGMGMLGGSAGWLSRRQMSATP